MTAVDYAGFSTSAFKVSGFGHAPVDKFAERECSAIKTLDAMVSSMPAPKKKKKKKKKVEDEDDRPPSPSPDPASPEGEKKEEKKKKKKSPVKKELFVLPPEIPIKDQTVEEALQGASAWNNAY